MTDTFQYDAWGNEVARTGATPTPYTWVGRWGYQHDTPTGGYYIRARSYQPTVARWMSVDPIETIRPVYAYIYGGNTPLVYVDPSGMDFIAVADAPAGIAGWAGFRHYSAQLWRCCAKLTPASPLTGLVPVFLQDVCNDPRNAFYSSGNATKVDARELVTKYGWKVWGGYRSPHGIGTAEWRVYIPPMTAYTGISVIMKSDSGVRILPLFDGTTDEVNARWSEVLRLANNYEFAEHWDGDNGSFFNWPKSWYVPLQTNSNTFVRHILGNLMVEMDGGVFYHPGRMTPSQNSFPTNWAFIASQVPFKGATPPRPTGSPPVPVN